MKRQGSVVNKKNYKSGRKDLSFRLDMVYSLDLRALTPQDWDAIGAGSRAANRIPALWGASTQRLVSEAIAIGAGFPIGRDPWAEVWQDATKWDDLSPWEVDLLGGLTDVYKAAKGRCQAIIS